MNPASVDRLADHLLIDQTQRQQLEQYIEVLEQLAKKDGSMLEHWTQQQDSRWTKIIEDLAIRQPTVSTIQQAIVERLTMLQTIVSAVVPVRQLHTVAGWQDFIGLLLPHLPAATQRGRFLKWSTLERYLVHTPPPRLLKHLGYKSVEQCLAHESIVEVMAALRFTEDNDWMQHFLHQYRHCQAEDFEERPVQFLLLDPTKWWALAQPFAEKKKHHFSHLKEAGVIFAYPAPQQEADPRTLPIFILMVLHYINEVHFYARWIEQHRHQPLFGLEFVRILKGDGSICPTSRFCLPIVQQYHLKRPNPHPCAYLPHVMPEALHWRKAFQAFFNLLRQHPQFPLCAFWENCYTVGQRVSGQLLTFNIADNILTPTNATPLTYHYKEDVWNTLFSSYLGSSKLEHSIIQQLAKQYINLRTL